MAEKGIENQYRRWIPIPTNDPYCYFRCPHCGEIYEVQPWMVKKLHEIPFVCWQCGNQVMGIEGRK